MTLKSQKHHYDWFKAINSKNLTDANITEKIKKANVHHLVKYRTENNHSLVHLILSKIKTIEDIDFAFNDLLSSGDLIKNEEKELKVLVVEVVQHPKLRAYYSNKYQIFNERDIITETGRILRPDRININSKNEVIIIDYKTGEEKANYKSQLDNYASVLETMNYTVKHKFIVYINDIINVIEV